MITKHEKRETLRHLWRARKYVKSLDIDSRPFLSDIIINAGKTWEELRELLK